VTANPDYDNTALAEREEDAAQHPAIYWIDAAADGLLLFRQAPLRDPHFRLLLESSQVLDGVAGDLEKAKEAIRFDQQRRLNMGTDVVALKEESRKLRKWASTSETRNQLQAALGGAMDVDLFMAHMMTAFQSDKIRACTAESKFRALHECAAMALIPTLGQVVLIPYAAKKCPQCGGGAEWAKGKKGVCVCHACRVEFAPPMELKCTPQWQGYKALMERNEEIADMTAVLVHVKDSFSMVDGVPQHSFDPFDPARLFRDGKDLRGGYCKITYSDGRPVKYFFMSAAEIEKRRKCAETDNVWQKWFEQMALKSVYRGVFQRRVVTVDPLVSARLERVEAHEDAGVTTGGGLFAQDEPDERETPRLPAYEGAIDTESQEPDVAAEDVSQEAPAVEDESQEAPELPQTFVSDWQVWIDGFGSEAECDDAEAKLAGVGMPDADRKTIQGMIAAKRKQYATDHVKRPRKEKLPGME
jgi:recombinational DNA repair protein RecT